MYVLGYPRSGNTWLCYLLAYCLNTEYDDLDQPGVHPQNEYQRRYVKGGLPHASHAEAVGQVLKTHGPRSIERNGEHIVCIVRDVRDVMVSYYYYSAFQTASQSTATADTDDPAKFSEFVAQHVPEWVGHVQACMDMQPEAIVRYEDLLTAPQSTLRDVFLQLGVTVADEVTKEGLEVFAFEKLAHREPGDENRKAFFRKGVAGGWREHFSREDEDVVMTVAADALRRLGYALDSDQR